MNDIVCGRTRFTSSSRYDDERMVYVCSQFSGDEQANIAAAQRYCRYVVEMDKQPVASHLLYPQFMTDETEREKAMEFAIRLLLRCGELWVFGDGRVSEGMQIEIMIASKYHIPILFQQEGYEAWEAKNAAGTESST